MHSLNLFWRDVFTAVCEFRMLVQNNILLTPLWCNETFNINNRYMSINSWFKNGLVYINDFIDENHDIMSLQDINDRFSLRIPFTTYFSIVRNIRSIIHQRDLDVVHRPIIPKYLNLILSDKKGCKKIYDIFISISNDKPKHESKWEHIFNINVKHYWWKKHYQIPFQVTKDTKLQWLQYRINYRILAINSYLFKIKYIDSDTCSCCNIETETITHLFWDCI